jgi:HEAT repeat protein
MTQTVRILLSFVLPTLVALPAASQSDAEAALETERDLQQAGCIRAPVYTPLDVLQYSTDVLCRFRAVQYLGLKGDRQAVPALEAAFKEDSDPGVRNQALVELIRLGQKQYVAVAREIMEKSTSLATKAGLAGQLAEVGDASGLPYHLEACRSQEVQDRQSCATTIGMYRKLAAKDPTLLRKLLDQILVLAGDPDAGVRQFAMLAAASYSRAMALPRSFMSQLDVLASKSTDGEVQRLIRNIQRSQESRQ